MDLLTMVSKVLAMVFVWTFQGVESSQTKETLTDRDLSSTNSGRCHLALSALHKCSITDSPLSRTLRGCDQALSEALACIITIPTTAGEHAQPEQEVGDEIHVRVKRGLGRCIHTPPSQNEFHTLQILMPLKPKRGEKKNR